MVTQLKIRYLLILVLVIGITKPVLGQRWKLRRYEVGGGIGMTQIFGDIGGTIDKKNWFGLKDIKFDETSPAFPLYIRYRLDPVYALKLNGILAFGNGTDENSRNDRGRSYSSIIGEFSVQGEFYFLAEERRYKSAAMFNRRGMLNNYMSFGAYGFAGIGAVYSRATVNIPDPLPYDRIKNNNFGAVIPFGIGLKYIIDDRWLVNAELGYRISLTDYIDGYKQTQDSKHNDVYYFVNISVGYRLETTRQGLPTFLDKEFWAAKPKRKSKHSTRRPRSKKEALE